MSKNDSSEKSSPSSTGSSLKTLLIILFVTVILVAGWVKYNIYASNDSPDLKGVSLGGIPIPNAWLGYMKNKNLLDEFETEGGFWQLFSEGYRTSRLKKGTF